MSTHTMPVAPRDGDASPSAAQDVAVTATPISNKKSFKAKFRETGWRHVVGVIVGAYALFPIIWVVSTALNPTGTLTGSNALFTSFSFHNLEVLLNNPDKPFGKWMLNTLYVGGVVSLGTVFMGAMAAYAFSRMRFKGRRLGLLSLLLVQMFPQVLAVIAIFLLLLQISYVFPGIGLGTRTGLIMVYLGGALGVNTYLMYGFFNTVPQSIDEAARIDGAGHARIFFTIILRLVFPILIVVGLLSFISVIGDFVVASVVLKNPDTWTLAVGLRDLVADDRNSDWGAFAAGAVLAALPVLAIFMALQKYIVSGLTAGAVK